MYHVTIHSEWRENLRCINDHDKILDIFKIKRSHLLRISSWQRHSCRHGRSATVHLKRAHRSNENDGVGNETRVATLDVEELLHADVGAETRLGN